MPLIKQNHLYQYELLDSGQILIDRLYIKIKQDEFIHYCFSDDVTASGYVNVSELDKVCYDRLYWTYKYMSDEEIRMEFYKHIKGKKDKTDEDILLIEGLKCWRVNLG